MMQQDREFLTAHKLKSKKNQSLQQIMKNGTVGEIIEVEGGHIIKATGKKDRHSKVYTAKGARDRRVRLSANTAIQFYDVQDRLGYDRPSKAIDWLLEKAKYAIDKLEQEDSTNKDESQDLGFLLNTHNNNNRSNTTTTTEQEEQLLHLGSNSIQFEQNYTNLVGEEGEINRVNGFVFNPQTIPQQQLFGSQNSAVEFSQRESLQSNYSQNLLQYSWNERMLPSLDQQIVEPQQPTFQPCLYNFYFGSNFQPTDQTHGQEEH